MNRNSSPHTYRAFGLNICCDQPLASDFGLRPLYCSQYDIDIRTDKVPSELDKSIFKNNYISYNANHVLMKIPEVATYLISDGKEIIIDIIDGAKDGDVATFTFGSAMGTLLFQRNMLALHGSAIRTPRGAIIFAGEKGAGKSTTAAALSQRGYQFMSDDVCAISFDNGTPLLYPGLSRAKLTEDSYSKVMGHSCDKPMISPIMKKYAAPFDINEDPSPIYAICILDIANDQLNLKKIIGSTRMTEIMRQIYRPMLHKLITPAETRFNQIAALSSHSTVFKCYRTLDYDNFDYFLNFLDKNLVQLTL